MNSNHCVFRVSLLVILLAAFLFGCSGGGNDGSPVSPDVDAATSGDETGLTFTGEGALEEQPSESTPASTGEPLPPGMEAQYVTPDLAWEFTEPAYLLQEGWGNFPATLDTSFNFSARLYGEEADRFTGTVDISLDGNPVEYTFDGTTVSAMLSDMGTGRHTLYLMAAGSENQAGTYFRFEVLDRPPLMQIGFTLDDGNLWASFDRPMPTNEIGDLARWSATDLGGADIGGVEVQHNNMDVKLWLTEPRFIEDEALLEGTDLEPAVEFRSDLGEIRVNVLDNTVDAGEYLDREACTACSSPWPRFPIDTNCFLSNYTVDTGLIHATPWDGETRRVFNAEGAFAGGSLFPYKTGWWDCDVYVCVHHSWILEGHNDPASYWNDSYDVDWYNDGVSGWTGVGYRNYHQEFYPRNYAYFEWSKCDENSIYALWELRTDCYSCGDPFDPYYGYESSGWSMHDVMQVDYDCPDVTVMDFVTGAQLDSYVQNVLIPDFPAGNAYCSDGGTDYYNHYRSVYGYWADANPTGVAIVMKASDPDNGRGHFLLPHVSFDYQTEQGGTKYIDEDMVLNLYYVDLDTPAALERKTWWAPYTGWTTVPADQDAHGEYSYWILTNGCDAATCYSARARVKDAVNNWTRTEDLQDNMPDLDLTITSPLDGSDYDYLEPVVFTAEVTGGGPYFDLDDQIQWTVLEGTPGSITGPLTGPTITNGGLIDCTFTVKASINVCGQEYYDICSVDMVPEFSITINEWPPWEIYNYGQQINLTADLTPSKFDSFEPFVDWYIVDDPWDLLNQSEYQAAKAAGKFDSDISQAEWVGEQNFQIDALKDFPLIVYAEITICDTKQWTSIYLYAPYPGGGEGIPDPDPDGPGNGNGGSGGGPPNPPVFAVEALGILVPIESDYSNVVRGDIAEIGGTPGNPDLITTAILPRSSIRGTGEVNIFAAVRNTYDAPENVIVNVTSTDASSTEITVHLYPLDTTQGSIYDLLDVFGDGSVTEDPSDPTHSLALAEQNRDVFMSALFAGSPKDWTSAGWTIYGRGSVWDASGGQAYAAPLIVSDYDAAASSILHEPEIAPVMYVSSSDALIGIENRDYHPAMPSDNPLTHDQAMICATPDTYYHYLADFDCYGEVRGRAEVITNDSTGFTDYDTPQWYNDVSFFTPIDSMDNHTAGGIERLTVSSVSHTTSGVLRSEADVMIVDAPGNSFDGDVYGFNGERDVYHSDLNSINPSMYNQSLWRDLEWLVLMDANVLYFDGTPANGAYKWFTEAVFGNTDVDMGPEFGVHRVGLRSVSGFFHDIGVFDINTELRDEILTAYGSDLDDIVSGLTVDATNIYWYDEDTSLQITNPDALFFHNSDLGCLAWMQSLAALWNSPTTHLYSYGHDKFSAVQEISESMAYWHSQYSYQSRGGVIPLDPLEPVFQCPTGIEIHRETY